LRFIHLPLAIKELGFRPVWFNFIYRLGLLSGYYRLTTPIATYPAVDEEKQAPLPKLDIINGLLSLAQPGKAASRRIIKAADDITEGSYQHFGGIPTPIQFDNLYNAHWTSYELGRVSTGVADIKDIWEPARFSWVCTLAQAYHLNHDEKYVAFFWTQFDAFVVNNPPNTGPNWMNGQEVALRLIAFVFAWQAFSASPKSTIERTGKLQSALAAHARRIISTLPYARSQRNNHLLSEAAGLYTAGLLLPNLHGAHRWKRTGRNLFIQGMRDQITPSGGYIQQSVSYHRLMLQLAIWMQVLTQLDDATIFPDDVLNKIGHAIHWLEQLIFSKKGKAPNLGANDGANILPIGSADILDYRPVIEQAKFVFPSSGRMNNVKDIQAPDQVIVIKESRQTACLRTARYPGRPSHADQLHLDLWWNNRNIALDAGTYRYNAFDPWENVLSGTVYHNTLTINGMDQMIRAGRFLWLRQAQIHHLSTRLDSGGQILEIHAEHDGYQHIGATHARKVSLHPGGKRGWLVQDDILPVNGIPTAAVYAIRLAWLLPDWQWELDGMTFRIFSPSRTIRLNFTASGVDEKSISLNVYRAGEALTDTHISDPTWGWHSPIYGLKEPALAVHLTVQGTLPLQVSTRWHLPA
jgi:hypothetical protein